MPAYNELKMLYASLTEVGNALNSLDIENPYPTYRYFSSTREYTANKYRNIARGFWFTDEEYNQFQPYEKDEYKYVCAIHTF